MDVSYVQLQRMVTLVTLVVVIKFTEIHDKNHETDNETR